jgi:hypothetical protein
MSLPTDLFKRAWPNLAIAIVAPLLFHLLSVSSGKIDANQGRGWDGRAYAEMASVSLTEGNAITRARPLVIVPAAALHRLGVDVVQAFLICNYVYAFVLALAICALLDLFAVPWAAKLTVVANVGLCVASSKMYAFYPVQIDLGALAVITWTFYFSTAGRHGAAACCGVLAATSREFGIAALLYGVVTAWRSGGRRWRSAALYLPAFVAFAAVRMWAVSVGPPKDEAYVTVASALANLLLWQQPLFVLMFGYFMLTLFGGLTMALVARPVWLVRQLIARFELLIFLAPVVAAAAAGSIDIWRYLAFALPAVIAVIGRYIQSIDQARLRPTMILMTLVTVVTQRPFEQMNGDSYFRDWFPLYTRPEGLDVVWSYRILATLLFCGALALLTTRLPRRHASQTVE